MELKKIRIFAVNAILIIIVGWVGYFAGEHDIHNYQDIFSSIYSDSVNKKPVQKIYRSQNKKDVSMDLFWQVWHDLENSYIFEDKIDYQKMVYGAIKGMTSALGDPYTAFYPPADNRTSKENLSGAFYGVGIQLGYKSNNQLAVIAPLSGMPAEKQGVKAGDYILKIIDKNKGIEKDTYGMSLMEAVEIIRGEKDTDVTLTLLHDGDDKTYEVTIRRQEIIVPSVEVEFVQLNGDQLITDNLNDQDSVVAHLKLSRFGDLTASQWDEAIDKILAKEKKLSGIVLDVRNNPGGYLQESVNLASEFLPIGKTVVIQESTNRLDEVFKTNRYGRLLDTPLIVLINGGSASASEILSGALRDHGRAILAGTKSFGKGTVQSANEYPDGSSVHITIAKWLTPNRVWVHEKGINPDLELVLDENNPEVDTQLIGAIQSLTGQTVTVGLPSDSDVDLEK